MKSKRIFIILAITTAFSCTMAACSFGGGDDGEDQVVVDETTPTPEPTVSPTPTPTISPNMQDSTYTSSTGSISIKLPDATWSNKTDEEDTISFESPEQGRILILHGQGEEDMSSAVIPDTQDLAVSLEQASDMTQGTDFEIQDYTANDVNGVGVYSYTVRYLNTEKSNGYAYAVNKIYANADEFYSICGSVLNDASLEGIKSSIDSFQIVGDSGLKAAASGSTDGNSTSDSAGTDNTGAAGDTGAAGTATGDAGSGSTGSTDSGTGSTDSGTGSTDSGSGSYDSGSTYTDSDSGDYYSDGYISNSAGFTQEQLRDTNQTRTIYRNSDGHPLVITPDGNGNWVDFDGNTYWFANDEDVYDQNEVDYYWHGEGADVYYMPVE